MATNRRGRATRQRLLDAAEEALADQGLEVTVDDVARRAGVARPTVHRHFGTREDLLVAVLLRASARLAEDLDAVFAGPEPYRDRLGAVVVRTVGALRRPPVVTWLMAGPPLLDAWPQLDPDDRFLSVVRDYYRPLLAAAADEGEALRVPVDVALDWMLRAILSLVLVPSAIGPCEDAVRRDVARLVLPSLLEDRPAPGASR